MDGVCSVASEEIRFDDWNIDVVIGASQKGLGAPPGLSVVIASQTDLKTVESLKAPIAGFYSSWKRWLPIMKAYEAGTPAYFATPPVNLIRAYHASLTQILRSSVSLQERLQLHKEAAQRVRQAAKDLGLKLVPTDEYYTANGLSAVRPLLLSSLTIRGITFGYLCFSNVTYRSTCRKDLVLPMSFLGCHRRGSSLPVVFTRRTRVGYPFYNETKKICNTHLTFFFR